MILHQLIHRLDLLQRSLHINPIRLNDLVCAEIRQLLDKSQHPRSQGPHARLPFFDAGVMRAVSPDARFDVVDPGLLEELFDVFE
jgi:hypothetical protein